LLTADIVQQNGAMRQRALQAVLLVHAIEQADPAGDALPLEDRAQASREAADGHALPTAAPAQLDGDPERFLVRRADALLVRLRVRSPGIDRILAAAAGPTGLDRAILLLGLAIGFGAAFADRTRIDIFAYPLIALVLWNLIVYIVLIVRTFSAPRQGTEAAVDASLRQSVTISGDGFLRRWLTRLYANRVRARVDALIAHSIGFNAPLAPGLRRFATEWWEVGQPLFRARAQRLLHLAAILAGVGLAAGYAVRGWLLREAAGWGATVFGPASAHTALVALYGAASAVFGDSIPSARALQALAWTSPTAGGGPAAPWLHLIGGTVLLYIVMPRLIAVIATTLSLWRRAATLRAPPSFTGYFGALRRTVPPPAAPPPAESDG
jgi:hypothetical protein